MRGRLKPSLARAKLCLRAGHLWIPPQQSSQSPTALAADSTPHSRYPEVYVDRERAKTLGVPIYTIALGTPTGQVTVQDQFGQDVTLDVPRWLRACDAAALTSNSEALPLALRVQHDRRHGSTHRPRATRRRRRWCLRFREERLSGAHRPGSRRWRG